MDMSKIKRVKEQEGKDIIIPDETYALIMALNELTAVLRRLKEK